MTFPILLFEIEISLSTWRGTKVSVPRHHVFGAHWAYLVYLAVFRAYLEYLAVFGGRIWARQIWSSGVSLGAPSKKLRANLTFARFPYCHFNGSWGGRGRSKGTRHILAPLYPWLEVQHLHHGVSNVTLVLKPALYWSALGLHLSSYSLTLRLVRSLRVKALFSNTELK